MKWRIIIRVQFISALECLEFYKHVICFHGLKHGLFGFSLFVLPFFIAQNSNKTKCFIPAEQQKAGKP